MEIFKGTATFSGIAIGKILYYYSEEYLQRKHMANDVKEEIAKFDEVRLRVLDQLEEEKEMIPCDSQNMYRYCAWQELLQSTSYIYAVESMISSEKVKASYAVQVTRDELLSTFGKLDNPMIRMRIQYIEEISKFLIKLLGEAPKKIDFGNDPVIVVSENLTPSDIMGMDKEKIKAFVTQTGSEISHASIMAKTMEIPSLVDVQISEDWDGMLAIVDGYTGTIYLDPEEEIMEEYELLRRADLEAQTELLKMREKSDVTIDGKQINVLANIGNLDDLNSVLYYGASGIGLLRSEFQYLGRENYPREYELFKAYKKAAQTMGERPVIIRTVDLGADKQCSYLEIPEEVNPIMGNRGIRLCLDRTRMFKAQLRAIYKASVYGNLAIMFPMIASEEEVIQIEKILEEVKQSLLAKDIPFRDIKKGIMIETPAAVMISRELAKHADFLSIGTNDLTQYTLAMDRQNPLLRDKYNNHHPAVLRMIQMVIEEGHKEGCEVYLCGEIAADTGLTGKFLRMGVDSLSVVPACILPIRKIINETDLRITGE